MTIQIEKDSAAQAILDILAEGHTQPTTLYRIAQESSYGPRIVSSALHLLTREGLVVQLGHGQYQLTDLGVATIAEDPELSSLNVIQPHPGPSALDVETGNLSFGINTLHNDVQLPLWDAFGAKPVLVSGASGSGKTELLAGVVESATSHYPNVRTWIIDSTRQLANYWEVAQRVGSDYDLGDDRVSGSASDLLRDVISVQHDRSRILAQTGYRCWSGPFNTPSLPVGVLVISSLNELRDKEFFGLLQTVMRMARKTGIVVVTDVADLSIGSFGNDFAIRDGFQYGTVLRMRSVNPLDLQIGNPNKVNFPDLPMHFSNGQSTAGVGYLPSGKLFRAFWSPGL